MNKNVLIVLAGGFLIAVLVALIVNISLSGSKKKDEMSQSRVQILVAAKNLKTGHDIKEGDFKWHAWPEDTLFTGAIIRDGDQKVMDVSKGKLLRPLVEGQPVHMTLLSEEGQGNFLAANLQKGMRAVAISVKSYVVADRLIRPGDFIDVLVTYKLNINSRDNADVKALVNRYATETVIRNVQILAIDKEETKAVDDEDDGDGKKKKSSKSSKNATVTLEVTPEDAEKLALSNKMGDLAIALRSIGDNGVADNDNATTDVDMSHVMTTMAKMRGGLGGGSVRIYEGSVLKEERGRALYVGNENIDYSVEDKPPEIDDLEDERMLRLLELDE